MHRDDIIAEVWRNRDAYARAHHHDLNEIVADLRKREQEHPHRVVGPSASDLPGWQESVPGLVFSTAFPTDEALKAEWALHPVYPFPP